jgi:hypothetical protein
MIAAVVGLFVIGGYWLLVRLDDRGHLSAPFVLAAMPLAVLPLAASVPLTAIRSIRQFQAVAESHQATRDMAVALAINIVQPLALGAVAFVVALVAAGALHALRGASPVSEADAATRVARPRGAWGHVVLIAASLLTLPTLLLASVLGGIAPLIAEAGRVLAGLSQASPGLTIAGMDLRTFSAHISNRLIAGTLGGFVLFLGTVALAVMGLVAARYGERTPAITRLSWIVFGLLLAPGVWLAATLTIDVFSAPGAVR